MTNRGFVSLVGAGPGEPGLITVLGARRLAEADIIVYDRLASPRLLQQARADAELIYAGKKPGAAEMTQDQINETLVRLGSKGKRVVRLKGGDPYVFGRGGEEGLALRRAGVSFEVIPGITSALAAPAYAGIPVTHRNVASSFAVITGHEESDKEESAIDWEGLASGPDTLIFLMGVKTLPAITAQLIRHGRNPHTPVALVRWGSLAEQTTMTGTLEDIAALAADARLKPPVVTVVGEVVNLRAALGWFEERPLFGKTVLVTRARAQASDLVRLLGDEGASVIELPAIEIVKEADAEVVTETISELRAGEFDWVIFTSANGVDIFWEHLRASGGDSRYFGGCRLAAIGPATAGALAGRGLTADIVPDEYIAEGIIVALGGEDLGGQRVLIPRAEAARRELIDGLAGLGARVSELTLYRAARPQRPARDLVERVHRGEVDVATFASSSTVRNLAALLGDLSPLGRATIASIGPVTSATIREHGLEVDIEAEEHSVPGLVEAVCRHFTAEEAMANA